MSGHTDLPTPVDTDTSPDLYGAHALGIPSTDLAPIRPDLPSGRRRANVLTQVFRTVRGAS